jgi:hypothetical protein
MVETQNKQCLQGYSASRKVEKKTLENAEKRHGGKTGNEQKKKYNINLTQ